MDSILITGATGFIGKRLAAALAAQGSHLVFLCRDQSLCRAQSQLDQLAPDAPVPLLVNGDLDAPGLGMQPEDRRRLGESIVAIFHLGAIYHMGVTQEAANRTNVDGTSRMLELAATLPRLERFHHVSTLAVSGDYQEVFREDDLDLGQGFDHAYGRSKFLAEKRVREAGSSIPITVHRPGIVVGDSRTGEMDKVDGPYHVFRLLGKLSRIPGMTRLPMIVPRESDTFLHMIPVDYVVAAMLALARTKQSLGRTYHLLDPNPLSFRDFYTTALREMGFKGKLIPRPIGRTIRLVRWRPFRPLTRLAGRALDMPAEMLPHFLYRVRYDTSHARQDLARTGIDCPQAQEYLPRLIRTFRERA